MGVRAWCRCGWSGDYDTQPRADYAARRHSCAKHEQASERRRRARARRRAVDRTPKPCHHKQADHQHGTYACYVLDRCRCHPCKDANTAYESNRARQTAYGRSNLVDAQPARDHVRALGAAGMGWKRVADVAGVSHGALWKLMYGKRGADGAPRPSRRVTRAVSDRLLAVTLDLRDGAVVDQTSTTLRVRALVALGWSQSKIAQRLGIGRANFTLARGDQQITLRTRRAVSDLYDELSMRLPPAASHRDKIAAARARGYAAQRGWQPPLALDDDALARLDDDDEAAADEVPAEVTYLDEAAIYRRTRGDRSVRLTPAEAAEVVRRWAHTGRSRAECARLTGLNPDRYKEAGA